MQDQDFNVHFRQISLHQIEKERHERMVTQSHYLSESLIEHT
jgi:hypothetical protein